MVLSLSLTLAVLNILIVPIRAWISIEPLRPTAGGVITMKGTALPSPDFTLYLTLFDIHTSWAIPLVEETGYSVVPWDLLVVLPGDLRPSDAYRIRMTAPSNMSDIFDMSFEFTISNPDLEGTSGTGSVGSVTNTVIPIQPNKSTSSLSTAATRPVTSVTHTSTSSTTSTFFTSTASSTNSSLTPTPSLTLSSSVTPTIPSAPPPTKDTAASTSGHTVPIKPIIGGAVGGAIAILLLILSILFFTRLRGKKAREIIDIDYDGSVDPKVMAIASQVTPFPGATAGPTHINNLLHSHPHQIPRSQSTSTHTDSIQGPGFGHEGYLGPLPAPLISHYSTSSLHNSDTSNPETSTTASRSDVPSLPSRSLQVVGGNGDPDLPPEYSAGPGPSRAPVREKFTYNSPGQQDAPVAGTSGLKS